MTTLQNSSNKKLTISLILFIIAVIAFGVAIYGIVSIFKGSENFILIILPGMIYLPTFYSSILLNYLYRKNKKEEYEQAGWLSTVLFVLMIIMSLPTIIGFIIALALWFLADAGASPSVRNEAKRIEAKDKEGKEHNLTPTHSGFITNYYKDESGAEWKSMCGDQTFERIITEAEVSDSSGNKYKLKAIFSGSSKFIDQNGDYWDTYDGGKTFEKE